ncbi:uncharacterized protein V6R79_002240 [Siganus canaliculatus]
MEVEANRVDSIEEHMTPTEMLEKIAELDYSQSQLRNLNAEMRHWLDAADAEMAMLRSDNTTLRKQVKTLENIVSDAQQVEAGPCRSLQADELDVKRCYEEKIQKLEKESTTMKEQNKKITAESEIGEAQLGLQHRDDIIHQKNMLLKFSEETIEECSAIIEEEQDAEEVLQAQSLTIDRQMKRCSGVLETAVLRAKRFILSIFIVTILAVVASGKLFSVNNLWSSTHLLLQPYVSVRYGAMPPT